MSSDNQYRLGPLQLEILKFLWDSGEAGVADVHEVVGKGRDLAYTTVATMLRKMEARGLVAHESEGRRFIYRACVAEREVTTSMVDDVVDRLFEGSLADMVSHLLSTRPVDEDELRQLEKMLAAKRDEPEDER